MYIIICIYVCISFIYICTHVYIYIYICTHIYNTNGAAAKVMSFERLGKRYALALLGKINAG